MKFIPIFAIDVILFLQSVLSFDWRPQSARKSCCCIGMSMKINQSNNHIKRNNETTTLDGSMIAHEQKERNFDPIIDISETERTRKLLQQVIRNTWMSVTALSNEMSHGMMERCEDGLLRATTLLVLATLRRFFIYFLFFTSYYKQG